MITDLLLRWIVTALFVISAAECIFAFTAGRRPWTLEVGHVLHFVMAVAMAAMAWPRGAELPTTAPMWFFLAASLWFVVMGLVEAGHRGAHAYHAAMMLAMSWVYAVMGGVPVPIPSEGAGSGGAPAGHHTSTVTEAPGAADASLKASDPLLATGLNWLCAVGFAIAAVWWLHRYFEARRGDSIEAAHRHLGIACQAMMAVGMSIMFGVML